MKDVTYSFSTAIFGTKLGIPAEC